VITVKLSTDDICTVHYDVVYSVQFDVYLEYYIVCDNILEPNS